MNAQSGRGGILPKKSSRVEQVNKSLDLQIFSLVGYFKKINALNAFMKLFAINGVYINGFYKLKMAWNAVLLNTGKTPTAFSLIIRYGVIRKI